MDLALLLTVIGIIVTIVVGVWQIYLAQKQVNVNEKLKSTPTSSERNADNNDKKKDIEEIKPNKNNKILWIEDQILLWSPIMVLLENDGYIVQPVTNFQNAKEIILSGQKFDLILTDLMIPSGDEKSDLDGRAKYRGLELAKLAKDVLGDIPVIFLTVVTNPEIRMEMQNIGEYMIKPISPSVLREKVKLALLESRLRSSSGDEIINEIKRNQIELTSDSPYIRRSAIWALGELGHHDSKIIDALKEINKSDKDPSVREAAKEAIKKIQSRLKKSSSKRRKSL